LLPGRKAALDVLHGNKSHVLRGLGCERGTPARGAVEDEGLAAGKDRLVVGAFGVDPEFEHAARRMQRSGYPAFSLELAWVAKVDEDYVFVASQARRLFRRDRLDFGVGLLEQRLVALPHLRSRLLRMHQPRLSSLKKSLPLSSRTMKAGKSSTSMRQIASMPSSGYSTTSTLLMQSWASRAAGPPIEPRYKPPCVAQASRTWRDRLPLASITIEPPNDWNWLTSESIRAAVVGPNAPEAYPFGVLAGRA